MEQDEDSENELDEDTFFTIPKKPDWESVEGVEEYKQIENDVFLKWKRQLNKLQNKYPNLPPFEKNLDFWRQLWKIIELSDVVVQVVDARDPLFYASHDLSEYVAETSRQKASVLLLNKADYLTPKQRNLWAKYFQDSDMKTLFFSATDIKEAGEEIEEIEFNAPDIVEPPQVLLALKSIIDKENVTVGFLGYPNVGKSSTINRFLFNKRLQVSATPGKTKHYQTHVLKGGGVTLVDGPGLVIPNLKMTKQEMVLSGILPIDTLSNHVPVIEQLLRTRISLNTVVKHYGIMNSCLAQGFKDSRRVQNRESQQLLSALGLMRGFMKPGGVPDESRAAKVILKDFVAGKLLFRRAPPNVDQEEYDPAPAVDESVFKGEDDLSLEECFPELRVSSGVHFRGQREPGTSDKREKRHANRKKREKLRRLYPESPYQ